MSSKYEFNKTVFEFDKENKFEDDRLKEIRLSASKIIANAGESYNDETKSLYTMLIQEFIDLGGSKNDFIVKIAEKLFDFHVEGGIHDRTKQGPGDDEPIPGSIRLDFDFLENFMYDTFLAVGVPQLEAKISANVLIEADKRGIDSHGVGRLKPIYIDRIKKGILFPYKPITILRESPTTALVDGNMGLGLYIGPYCMDLAISKAKKYGIGFVAAKNSTHYGIAGYYATMATEAGCIGFTGTNARPSIAPTFGVEPCLGTNPLCFGIPTDEEFPFVIDCATSINQRGKIEKYARLGLETPKGMVIDNLGNERTDTEQILVDMVKGSCALTPLGGVGDSLGGYKGYGWATVVELLSTAFQSGPIGSDLCGIDRVTGKPAPMPLGHYFLAIDIESITELDTFKANAGKLLKYLRNSEKDPKGPGKIWTAGEPEYESRISRTAAGGTVVPPVLIKEIKELRDSFPELQVKYPKFDFE